MAIGLNSRVRVKLTSAAFTGKLQPQPPLFGRVTTAPAPKVDVLTEQGDTVNVDPVSLNEITAATQLELDTYLYKIVVGLISAASPTSLSVQFGAAYVGRVVAVYVVDGAPSLLIQTLANDMFYEMSVGLVDILKDR